MKEFYDTFCFLSFKVKSAQDIRVHGVSVLFPPGSYISHILASTLSSVKRKGRFSLTLEEGGIGIRVEGVENGGGILVKSRKKPVDRCSKICQERSAYSVPQQTIETVEKIS